MSTEAKKAVDSKQKEVAAVVAKVSLPALRGHDAVLSTLTRGVLVYPSDACGLQCVVRMLQAVSDVALRRSSGQDASCCATRCAVLTQRIVLCGWYASRTEGGCGGTRLRRRRRRSRPLRLR